MIDKSKIFIRNYVSHLHPGKIFKSPLSNAERKFLKDFSFCKNMQRVSLTYLHDKDGVSCCINVIAKENNFDQSGSYYTRKFKTKSKAFRNLRNIKFKYIDLKK
jgi:hypothetical protein